MKKNDGLTMAFSDANIPLNDREMAFCLHVVKTNNAEEAYRLNLARPSSKRESIRSNAYRAMKIPHIAQHIAEMRNAAAARNIEQGVDALMQATDALIDIMNKGREAFLTADGIKQYHSLSAAGAAASRLIAIIRADSDTTIKLTRIRILQELKSKGLMTQSQLEKLTDEVIGGEKKPL